MIAGYGAWTIELKDGGDAVGLVSLNSAIALPDPELGWILWEGFEGHGYGFEAALNARQFAFDILQWPTLISGIHKENLASIRLAVRLEAILDRSVTLRDEPETLFYRHFPA